MSSRMMERYHCEPDTKAGNKADKTHIRPHKMSREHARCFQAERLDTILADESQNVIVYSLEKGLFQFYAIML